MKKTLLTIALAASFMMTKAQDIVVIEDFDTNRNLNAWIADSGTYFFSTTEIPGSASDTVGRYTLGLTQIDNGANYMGTRVNSIMGATGAWAGYNVDEYPFYSIDCYSSQTFNLALKVEDGVNGDPKPKLAEEYQDYTNTDEWQTLYFDLSDAVGLGSDNEMVFLFDLFNPDTEKVFYFDNFKAYKENPVGLSDVTVSSKGLNLFPNPVADVLELSIDVSNASSVTVYNSLGLVVLDQKVTSSDIQKLDVSGLVNGSYRVIVSSDNEIVSNSFVVLK